MLKVGSRPWAAVAVLCIGLAAGLTGCGGDDEESAADVTAACDAHVGVVTGFNTVFSTIQLPDNGPPPPEFKGQLQAAYDANVAQPLATLVADAPDEVKDEIEEISRKTAQFRDEADPSILDDDFEKLTDKVDAYMQEHCAGVKATVEAVNYAYRGLPSTLPATTTLRIEFRNTADEAHEMLVLTRKPGVTETFDQILALPPDQIESKFDFVNAESANPGQTGYLIGTLPAGDYIFLCSFGKGTTDDNDPKQDQPHFTLGMKQEVKVA